MSRNDTAGIQRSGQLLTTDATRVLKARASVGAKEQDITSRQDNATSENTQLKSALSLLADLTIWMQSGPSGILHALNLLDRRQFRVRAGLSSMPDADNALRWRVIGAGIIWGLAALTLGVAGGPEFWTPLRFPAILAGSFLAVWTIWLFRLLQRLAIK